MVTVPPVLGAPDAAAMPVLPIAGRVSTGISMQAVAAAAATLEVIVIDDSEDEAVEAATGVDMDLEGLLGIKQIGVVGSGVGKAKAEEGWEGEPNNGITTAAAAPAAAALAAPAAEEQAAAAPRISACLNTIASFAKLGAGCEGDTAVPVESVGHVCHGKGG